jgi:hypothetical protein
MRVNIHQALNQGNANFVVLQGINNGNVFWTTNIRGIDQRRQHDGTSTTPHKLLYNILAYTLTKEEAIAIWAMNIPAFLFKGLLATPDGTDADGIQLDYQESLMNAVRATGSKRTNQEIVDDVDDVADRLQLDLKDQPYPE